MFKSRLLLSLVALSVSFVISLLTTRDFGKSVLTGAITLFSSLVGASVAESRYRQALSQRAGELQSHIRALQRRRSETYESLVLLSQERDRISNSLNALQSQLRNLQVQSANLWQQKEELSWNLSSPQASPANEIYILQVKLQELEQKEAELNQSLSATLTAKQRAELTLKTTEAEVNQLKAQLVEQQNRKDALAQEVTALMLQKQQLESQMATLQPKVKELEHYRTELNQFLNSAEPKRQQVENSSRSLQGAIEQLQQQISSLHGELGQLETQILDRRHQKDSLDQELSVLRHQLETTPKEIAPSISSDMPPPEWRNFFNQLPSPESDALRAIVEQPNPNATLKQIAEAHLTMPELLIDSINERAIETIGDLIIEPNSGTANVAPEYLAIVRQLLDLNSISE